MSCNCIEILNKRFESENFFIPCTQWTDMSTFSNKKQRHKNTVIIQVNKIKPSKKSLVKIVPAYCPFCGNKYEYPSDT